MNKYGTEVLKWNNNNISFKGEVLFSLTEDTAPEMWYVVWPDGVKSEIPYNLPRAKQHAEDLSLEVLRLRQEIEGMA